MRVFCLDLKSDPQVFHIHEEYGVAAHSYQHFLMGSADLAHHCANDAAQQSFEASWVRLAYAVFSRLPLHRDAGAAAGSQNVAEAARAEATACVKQLQVVLTGALAAYS